MEDGGFNLTLKGNVNKVRKGVIALGQAVMGDTTQLISVAIE